MVNQLPVYFNNGRVVAFLILLSKRREDRRANEMKIRREMKVRAATAVKVLEKRSDEDLFKGGLCRMQRAEVSGP
jgi:hypothetical protein